MYHWRELPQVSFLSWQKNCCNKHMFVMTNMCFDKHMFWQTHVWHDKRVFVATTHIFCHYKSMLVATKYNFVTTTVLSRQAYFCHDKHVFVMTKHVFCHDKYACHDKSKHVFVTTNICCDDFFVKTNIILSRQKFCRSKHTFVATKIMFVAAPANDPNECLTTHLVPFVSQSRRSCQLGLSSGSPHRTYPVWGSGAPADHL